MEHIFGYGSLVNARTRKLTGETGKAIPVEVADYQRRWNVPIKKQNRTAFGVEKKEGQVCNGVVVEVSEAELEKFDIRETGYYREKISLDKIESNHKIPDGNIWIYIPEKPQLASEQYPIVQSYLDVTLEGCFEFSVDFAKKFIKTTKDWRKPWLNDRTQPRYPRYLDNLNCDRFDSFLDKYITNKNYL